MPDPEPTPGLVRARDWPRWIPALALGLALCVAPLGLWGDAVRRYVPRLDDHAYVASSGDSESLRRNLFAPHNAHVVPLFRLETFLLVQGAGSADAAPAWLGGAAFLTLVLASLAAGHLVARESGRAELGLAAMAAVGLSTILGPSVLWYSASQATLSGVMILLALIGLQAWRLRGGWPRLAVACLAVVAAPLVWSAGYLAGPVGAAYLWADGRGRCRKGAAMPLVVSAVVAVAVRVFAGREIAVASTVNAPGQPWEGWILRAIHAAELTVQSVAEFLVLGNLGIDLRVAATVGQGVAIGAVVAAFWVAWKRGLPPTPLEAAGGTMAILGFMMVYMARGGYNFANLRSLGWYHSVPQLGAVLFASGWFLGPTDPSQARPARPPGAKASVAVAILAAAYFALQSPRAHRIITEYGGLASPSGAAGEPWASGDNARPGHPGRRLVLGSDPDKKSGKLQIPGFQIPESGKKIHGFRASISDSEVNQSTSIANETGQTLRGGWTSR